MPDLNVKLRWAWASGAAIVLLAAFVYPLMATWNRTDGCAGHFARIFDSAVSGNCGDVFSNRTIDGLEYLKRNNEGEYEAIQWLDDRPGSPVVAEAVGDDYSPGGRVSAATGLPTLLQWPGHELQWRGTSEPQNGRKEDLETLYTSDDPVAVRNVIEKYGISFIFVGGQEREKYPNLAIENMTDLVEPATTSGDTTVLRVRPEVLTGTAQE